MREEKETHAEWSYVCPATEKRGNANQSFVFYFRANFCFFIPFFFFILAFCFKFFSFSDRQNMHVAH